LLHVKSTLFFIGLPQKYNSYIDIGILETAAHLVYLNNHGGRTRERGREGERRLVNLK
jgi:hypothetical protein